MSTAPDFPVTATGYQSVLSAVIERTVSPKAAEIDRTGAAMVVLMHYAAVAVIEVHGPQDVRRAIARGNHLSSLAFSEVGSRSHFWAPVGMAKARRR